MPKDVVLIDDCLFRKYTSLAIEVPHAIMEESLVDACHYLAQRAGLTR